MDGYEIRLHVNSILAVMGEILAEVKGMREDYAEGQAMQCAADNFTIMESFSLDVPHVQYYKQKDNT